MDDHQQSRRTVLGAATGLGLASLVLPAASAAASNVTPLVSTTTTFTAAGAFSVPDGITSVIVTAEGTAGGVPPAEAEEVALKNGTAGRGGRVVATVAVTPGSELQVVVGASVAGQPEPESLIPSAPYPGGAGGAAVGVRSGSTWLVVAGGGGGGAGGGLRWNSGSPDTYEATSFQGGNGGDATGPASPVAATSGQYSTAGGAASGGTAGSGGSGQFGHNPADDGANGSVADSSVLGTGGRSGSSTNPGGGGGAGYAGGGGGGASISNGAGSGGGGGSNYVDGSATSVVQGYSSRSLDDGVILTIQTVVD